MSVSIENLAVFVQPIWLQIVLERFVQPIWLQIVLERLVQSS